MMMMMMDGDDDDNHDNGDVLTQHNKTREKTQRCGQPFHHNNDYHHD